MDLGTLNASLVIFGLFLICFGIEMYGMHKAKEAKTLENNTKANDDNDVTIKAVVYDSGKNCDVEESIDELNEDENAARE